MRRSIFPFVLLAIGVVFVLSNCKEIKEEWLLPEWIEEKISILESDCYYDSSSIKRYIIDSVNYIEVYIPSNLWPELNVFYYNGTQVKQEENDFNYTDFLKIRDEAVETIWSFPDSKSCPK